MDQHDLQDTQKSKQSLKLKKGDLVKFKRHGSVSPRGIVVSYRPEEVHPYVVWCCEFTPDGHWADQLLEVVCSYEGG